MKANNLFAKPIVKAIFFILLMSGMANLAFLMTRIQPFTDLTHISISVMLFVISGLIMSRNLFIKYNSEDAVIEIERAGLFSSANTIHSGQLGFVKTEIQGYGVEKTWYGGAFTIDYRTSSGKTYGKRFPILFASRSIMSQLKEDLGMIAKESTVQPTTQVKQQHTKVLKNSPAFS